jgi:uncharacterized membrane protein YhaH (DUF805 family)
VNEPRYWFAAKTYGWGWGAPTSWQGWVVLLIYFAILGASAVLILPRRGQLAFVGVTMVATFALIAMCAWKGEPPRWRWGKDDQ